MQWWSDHSSHFFLSTGFLTSPELFYVRNHGPVPYVQDEGILNWEISIEGFVSSSFIKHRAVNASNLGQTGAETDCFELPPNSAAIRPNHIPHHASMCRKPPQRAEHRTQIERLLMGLGRSVDGPVHRANDGRHPAQGETTAQCKICLHGRRRQIGTYLSLLHIAGLQTDDGTAKRPLRHVDQVELGDGSQQGDHARPQDEWRVASPGSWTPA